MNLRSYAFVGVAAAMFAGLAATPAAACYGGCYGVAAAPVAVVVQPAPYFYQSCGGCCGGCGSSYYGGYYPAYTYPTYGYGYGAALGYAGAFTYAGGYGMDEVGYGGPGYLGPVVAPRVWGRGYGYGRGFYGRRAYGRYRY